VYFAADNSISRWAPAKPLADLRRLCLIGAVQDQISTGAAQRLLPAEGSSRSFTPSGQSGLAMHGRWKGLDLRATGLYGAGALSAVVLICFLVWLEPFKNAQHFLLTMLGCFVAGSFFTAGVFHGRLQDTLKSKDDFRQEMNRMAERNQELERIILKNRLSSAIEPQAEIDGNTTWGRFKGEKS
jgi:hypothetical protein